MVTCAGHRAGSRPRCSEPRMCSESALVPVQGPAGAGGRGRHSNPFQPSPQTRPRSSASAQPPAPLHTSAPSFPLPLTLSSLVLLLASGPRWHSFCLLLSPESECCWPAWGCSCLRSPAFPRPACSVWPLSSPGGSKGPRTALRRACRACLPPACPPPADGTGEEQAGRAWSIQLPQR